MRFGTELLRKAEQIFTIIHQASPQLICFSASTVSGVVKGHGIELGDEPRGCGVNPPSEERGEKGKGKWPHSLDPQDTRITEREDFQEVSTKGSRQGLL